MDAKKFGSFVQEQRKALGMNQAELAERIHVTAKAVSRWERGIGFPDIKLLQPLAEALGVTIPELIHGERIRESLSREEASSMVTQTVRELQEQEQLSWKRRLLLYGGNILLFAAYMFLYMLALRYPWEPWWLDIPIVIIAVYGFQYGIRVLKAIVTGSAFQWNDRKTIEMTPKIWASVIAFILGLGLMLFATVQLDKHKGLHDFLVVIGLAITMGGGVAYWELTKDLE